jgi:hypothetical protein
MQLQQRYPKLFDKLEDTDVELRHLLNVDENYEDYDSEEFEFDFEEYNYIIYIADPVKEALGEEKLAQLIAMLESNKAFENFVASEEDLYGVKSSLDEPQIAALVLESVEALL